MVRDVLLILSQYIALERLEAIYKACNLVNNMCVYANSDMKQPVAIIIPHEAHLRARLETLDGESFSPCLRIHKLIPL